MKENYIDLSDKSYLISGAGSGIGRAVAQMCNMLGAKVLLLDKDQLGLIETSKTMNENSYFLSSLDLTNFDSIQEAVSIGVDKLGKLNGFCHCAGFEYTLPIKSMKPKHYQELFNINTIAGFELARILSKKKYRQGDSTSFVFIASIMGIVSRPGLTGYSASKGALISGARSIALELANKKIRVNTISPGTIMTNLIVKAFENMPPEQREKRLSQYPLGFGTPDDVANAVVFLFSERSRWITGTNIVVDGVYTAK